MAQYLVIPDDRGEGWKVEKGIMTISRHNKKKRAIEAAREHGRRGDTLRVTDADGVIRETSTIRA